MKTLLILSLVSVLPVVTMGGVLDPADPPGSTMKTLDEVEPRIPIPASDTATTPFVIDESGSYYLTGNRHCSTHGIQVDANDVTIDLMGYSLIGSGFNGSGGVDIYGHSNVEVKNGTVRNFYAGVDSNYTSARGHRIINVRAVSNTNAGIKLYGQRHLVKNCTVADNGSGSTTVWGINAGEANMVIGNIVYNNGDSATGNVLGISASTGSTVTGNTVYGNGISSSGEYVWGISAGFGCTVIGNTAYKNGKNATSATGTVYGIYLSGSSLVDQNTAYFNGSGAAGTVINMNAPGSGTITASNYAP